MMRGERLGLLSMCLRVIYPTRTHNPTHPKNTRLQEATGALVLVGRPAAARVLVGEQDVDALLQALGGDGRADVQPLLGQRAQHQRRLEALGAKNERIREGLSGPGRVK